MSGQLQTLEPIPETVYLCPGETSPVNRAVHRARMAAGWPDCRGCPSRDDGQDENDLVDSATRQRLLIRQTEWGIRGAWQNALTRQSAAQLIGVVTGHIVGQQHNAEAISTLDDGTDTVPHNVADSPTVIMGYDSRTSSPDIYAGVVSASLQNGCHVIDAGRSTAASIQEICRTITEATAGLIVTGAGESSAVTGFDIFDACGQAISIPWRSSGVTVRRINQPDPATQLPDLNDHSDTIARLKHSIRTDAVSKYPSSASVSRANRTVTTLELPGQASGLATRYRIVRRSGTCRSIDAESKFRRWLRKWFPQTIETRVACICFDPLVAERIEWLFADANMPADIIRGVAQRSHEEQISQRVEETHAQWGICIAEDDRYMTVANQHGRCLTAEQLSGWINEFVPATRTHVTTHVPANENRVVLMDAGRPNQAGAYEVISDSTALMGCICRIVQAGTTLPRRD